MYLNIGSFNIRGLNSEIRKEQLIHDLESYNLDVLCIQETKIKDGDSRVIRGNQLLCFESNSKHYGCDFVINKRFSNSIHRFWKVSDRVCVLQIKLEEVVYKKSKTYPLISIINVYAPTSQRVEKYPDEIEQLYKDLNATSNAMNARFHCMFWKTDGVCSDIYCDATEKSQPIKPWKDSLSHKGTNTGEDQSLPCQWS